MVLHAPSPVYSYFRYRLFGLIMPSSVRELIESDARHFMAAYLPRSKIDALFVGGLAEGREISGDQREKPLGAVAPSGHRETSAEDLVQRDVD